MDGMEIGKGDDSKFDEIARSLDVNSPKFQQIVNKLAQRFGIVQHPDPVLTLKAVQLRITKLKSISQNNDSANKSTKPPQSIPLSAVEIGAKSTGSPKMDDAIRILRLLHGAQLRDVQTQINELVAEVQKITANPKCDLNLGKIGR